MTGTVAYILAKKLVSDATAGLTGVSDVTFDGQNLQFHLDNGTTLPVPIPENTGLVFTTEGEKPDEGKEDTLYIVDTTIQYWDGSKYVEITGGTSTPLEWQPIQE